MRRVHRQIKENLATANRRDPQKWGRVREFGRCARDRPRRGANERGRATTIGGSKMHRLFYTAPLVQLDNEELLQRRWYRSPATLRHDCDAIRSLRSLVARIKDVSLTTLAALSLAPPYAPPCRHALSVFVPT